MDNLFNYDNKFFQVLGKIADIIILNILFIISCIPIITIGGAISASYGVGMKIINNKEAYITKEYVKQFKSNFKESTIVWAVFVIVGILISTDFYISKSMTNKYIMMSLQLIFSIIGILFIFSISYVFPIISKFSNTIKNTIINSILISIQNLPYTILIVIVNLSPIVLINIASSYWAHIIFFYTVIGFSLIICLNCVFFNKIFEKYIN